MNFICKIFILICLLSFPVFASDLVQGLNSYTYATVDASSNATGHNSMGNIYFKEGNYVAALKEFEIAYNLAPNSHYAGTYLYNMARCFFIAKKYKLAKNTIQNAIKKDFMNITYYNMLADCTVALNEQDKEIKILKKDKTNPYNSIIIALIYIKTGNTNQAKMLLDDFINENPRLIIIDDVKAILRTL